MKPPRYSSSTSCTSLSNISNESTKGRAHHSEASRLAASKLRRHARLWNLAHEIVAGIDPPFARQYTAIALTKQFEGSPHIDTENVAPFYGLSLGDFTGGAICVESGLAWSSAPRRAGGG